MKYLKFLIFIVPAFSLSACNTIDVFEKTAPIPLHEWSSHNPLSFTFQAKDSMAYYNIYFVLRHTEAYHFNNIWIDFTATFPGKKPQTQRFNLPLANGEGWIGTAMDDIVEQRVLLFNKPSKLDSGAYTFMVRQVMREEPLENILNAGVRVEKVVR
ncbi:gliding motility lipoprotein GldH [Parafilimonas sp.]|uniref:gliding motility lipoprotein GldH n=1 Tax=Parafilimonas sp. TaxID=1969739 RepID=UPI0039E4412E